MANTDKAGIQSLLKTTEKALRRGKKLERSLLKIISQSEAGSATEDLLKSLRHGMKQLKKAAKESQGHHEKPKVRAPAPVDEKTKRNDAAPSPSSPAKRPRTKSTKVQKSSAGTSADVQG